MKNKRILIFLCVLILIPNIVLAKENQNEEIQRVIDRGYMGKGKDDWNSNLNRAELATIAVRLMDLETEAHNYKGNIPFIDVKDFQGGWATSYVALAYRENIIRGISPTKFNPRGQVSYIEMVTVFMRILGYRDGLDFVDYPEDYYTKAISIDLAEVYIDTNRKVTRKDVALTIEKLLDCPMKNADITLAEKLDKKPGPIVKDEKVFMTNVNLNTAIMGMFSGQLYGKDDFKDYKVELISKEDKYGRYEKYGETIVEEDGSFKIWGFDTGFIARNRGYRYRVYDGNEKLILEGNL